MKLKLQERDMKDEKISIPLAKIEAPLFTPPFNLRERMMKKIKFFPFPRYHNNHGFAGLF